MKELKFEELTLQQKLGMVMPSIIRPVRDPKPGHSFDENLEFTLEMIRKRSLGAVWIPTMIARRDEVMAKIKETADYPILIMTDAESGLGDYQIGRHNTIGMTGSEELAYTFGKVTAITARKMGYNIIGDPVLDMLNKWGSCGANCRSLGCDKVKVASLAVAEARGIRDGGVLTLGKHYPGGSDVNGIDSHMTEGYSENTKEELLDYWLYPYLELMKQGLLDGIMTSHRRFAKIDPVYPASLSRKVIDIIREQGFDGIAITDALDMMGIKAKFGDTNVKGMCIEAGNDLILPWFSTIQAYRDLTECYEKGILSEERLNEAVRRVLAAQHKVMMMEPKYTEITEKDKEDFVRLNRDSVFARTDDGVPTSISRDGKHFFALLVRNETDIADDGKVTVDTFTNGWHFPARITKKIESLFPNSTVRAIRQFPSPTENMDLLQLSLGYEDVIFVTFAEAPAYAGSDHLTHRIVALIDALNLSGRLSTVVHCGNPYVLGELRHVPRILIGCISADSIDCTLDVLAGAYPAKGVMTYDVKFQ